MAWVSSLLMTIHYSTSLLITSWRLKWEKLVKNYKRGDVSVVVQSSLSLEEAIYCRHLGRNEENKCVRKEKSGGAAVSGVVGSVTVHAA